jgi:branched-chain amino acid transport system substrate-binding protein
LKRHSPRTIEQVQMMKFTGEKWQLFGPIIDGHAEISN